ncbi:ROK family protein [Planctomicrobium sp. SH661]|uniref:ROK family protein n=1 Tax=Planctomicrobium sp. SH661 TaxID=3448124 RepID=UPI003F5BF421
MPAADTARHWLGFDLGGTKMLAQVYDEKWNVIAKERKRIHPGTGAKGGIERIIETIHEALKKASLTPADLLGIGIGCPGPIEMDKGLLLDLPNLGWQAVPLKERLESALGCPVAVLNDVDAGVYSEYRAGAGQGARCVIGVFAGTGIGGGCVYRGEILRGTTSSCFEIGHVQVMSNGPRCGCGQRGCLESVSSRLAIAAQCARAAYRGDAPHLLEAAGTDIAEIRSGALKSSIEAGDQVVDMIIKEAARYIGIAVGSVVNLIAPEVVILGGGLVEAMPDLFVPQVAKAANKRVMPAYRDTFKVVPATLKDDAGVLGAALWAEYTLGPASRGKKSGKDS